MNATRKRLRYKATHRGTKEADKIIGGYAEAYLDAMTEDVLASFDRLLDESDHALLNWIMGAEPAPTHVDTNLLREIISFKDAL